MAKCNRDFLLPYLQNICTLQLVRKKLEQKVSELQSEKYRLKRGEYFLENDYPEQDYIGNEERLNLFLMIASLIIALLLGANPVDMDIIFGRLINPLINFVRIVIVVIAVLVFIFNFFSFFSGIKSNIDSYNESLEKYNEREEINAKIRKSNRLSLEKVPKVETNIQFYSKELETVKNLLSSLYNINIIPNSYRDLYASIYLYDFFNTSQEDDISVAIGLYILEQIKDKLDAIIRNQSELLINQAQIMANQQLSIMQQKDYQDKVNKKLQTIAQNEAERNTYLQMIENNTSATAYFAAATYFNNL